jgi:hypothetical protein
MEAIEHTWVHPKHVITLVITCKFVLNPFKSSYFWLPILSPIHVLVNVQSILVHTKDEPIIIIIHHLLFLFIKHL